MKFNTAYNYQYKEKLETDEDKKLYSHRFEYNPAPSMTTPDMAMTPREILKRFANGQSLSKSNNLMFQQPEGQDGIDYDVYPDLRKMDITEIQEMVEWNQKRTQEIEDEIKTKRKERFKQRLAEHFSKDKSDAKPAEQSDKPEA